MSGWRLNQADELTAAQVEDGRRARCGLCGGTHPATYSHEGRWREGAIYAVVCPEDPEGLVDWVTTEGLA